MSGSPGPGTSLPRSFYARDARVVARALLNKVLVRGERSGRIVEVEAYLGDRDAGSHAYRGPTRRNATMFGPAGHVYVYFTYGMHWCANVVCGAAGEGTAVLLRALEPLTGLELMRAARPAARRDAELCAGPARLCQAFGIDGTFDGVDLAGDGPALTIVDDGVAPPRRPGRSTRVGLRAGAEHPWRWFVSGSASLSRRPPGPRSAATRPAPRD